MQSPSSPSLRAHRLHPRLAFFPTPSPTAFTRVFGIGAPGHRKRGASAEYAALCSLGNLPVVYMTALDGWVHDRYGTAWMLHFNGLTGIVCIVFAMLAFHLILRRQAALIP